MKSTSPQIDSSRLRLLVTGTEGFVGRHVVQMVLERCPSAEVIACDVRPSAEGTSPEAERVEQKVLDVRDAEQCLRVLRETKPTHVLHAAAMTDGTDGEIIAVNAEGTENLMKAAADCGTVERGLLISSSAVYGSSSTETQCDEQHPLDLMSAYARSKRLAELCLPDLERATGVSLLSARLGPCYGPHEVAGPFRPRLSLVGRLVQATRDERCLYISGDHSSRDWTHLDQAVEAFLGLLTTRHLHHRLYNVSAGRAISSRDLIRCFVELGLRVQWSSPREADLLLDVADGRKPLVIKRLCTDTGFAPCTDWQTYMASLLQTSSIGVNTSKES